MSKNNETSITIIPAQPGYFIITTGKDDDREDVETMSLDPVIAWRVETGRAYQGGWNSFVVPINLEECVTNDGDWGILRPDGAVDETGIQAHPSAKAYLAAVRARYAGGA